MNNACCSCPFPCVIATLVSALALVVTPLHSDELLETQLSLIAERIWLSDALPIELVDEEDHLARATQSPTKPHQKKREHVEEKNVRAENPNRAQVTYWPTGNAAHSVLSMIAVLPAPAGKTQTIGARSVAATPLERGTIFVSPDGSGTGRSAADPCNLAKMNTLRIQAGEVVFLRGGVYRFAMDGVRRVYLKGGTVAKPIIYESYPGETAIFDGSAVSTDDTPTEDWREGRLHLRENYTILRKVEVRMMPTYGIRILGNHNTVEGCLLHDNHLSGLGIANLTDGYSTKNNGGSYNVVRDNRIYRNSDAGLKHHNYGDGDNADGIIIHSGVGNCISHNTVHHNSDDGIDTWKSMNSTVELNVVHHHGKGARGNGNGIKLGGAAKDSPLGANAIARLNVSYSNKLHGFNVNSGKRVSIEYNTSFANGGFGHALMDDTVLIGNLSLQDISGHFGWSKGKSQTGNSWQKEEEVKVMSTDPASDDFLKPSPSGAFDGMGAYARHIPHHLE